MAVAPILPVLLLVVVTRCKCDHTTGYNSKIGLKFGTILKPPPPPLPAPIAPVPFHREPERNQRQNADVGYKYKAPPVPLSLGEFKFPAPFYKQYNFNFVPPPQPFSTTVSPSMFQKVSGWLFPSLQTSHSGSTIFNNDNIEPTKKDCNPCNLVPWLPVIRYNVGAKSVYQNTIPTYGPPSPTAHADAINLQKYPQPFNLQHQNTKPPQLTPGVPHANYGPPTQNYNNRVIASASSTYGPPSATHTLDILSSNPPTSTFTPPSSTYEYTSTSFVLPSHSLNPQFLTTPSLEFLSNLKSYGTPSHAYGTSSKPLTPAYQSVTPQYKPDIHNKEFPQDDVELIHNITPMTKLQLPKTTQTTVFKNSYGEPITNTHMFDISYPISATADSAKLKSQAFPQDSKQSATHNVSFALANPAPFTLNRGRNIHTLQPVALPNLSVSPLPPIFNSRPFRPLPPQVPSNILQSINQMQSSVSNVNIQQSIPLTEFTHSVDYPATIIQSPVIEIDAPSLSNQTKGYRNIPNSYVVDEIRDISSQASEAHISATKSISDSSFETTGFDMANELYDSGIPKDLKKLPHIHSNDKTNFADLRGLNDEDLDRYRTENNLQNIDSPLLYLKPSAPHKKHGDFVLAISSPIPENDYEIYDETPTTAAPQSPGLVNSWDDSRNIYDEDLTSPSAQENKLKPKIVQIIVPYTTGTDGQQKLHDYVNIAEDWSSTTKDEYHARKIPSNVDNSSINKSTEDYSTEPTASEHLLPTEAQNYGLDNFNPTGSQKDVYDIKDPPFDIIKLQHTIDDWTEQEYSKQYKTQQKTRSSENYAKKIPDEYFTTVVPNNFVMTTNNYDYDFYDHEGSSSIQHSVTNDINNTTKIKAPIDYNVIESAKIRHNSAKNEDSDETQKLHIYTAASSFRTSTTSTTTTPAPWETIQTSISPLTKEKVYVVTSKPWKDSLNASKDWYKIEPFESNKTRVDSESFASNKFLFKSPRFINRPSFGFTSGGKIESDTSYGFSKSWYQSINELKIPEDNINTALSGVAVQRDINNSDEVTSATTTNPRGG